MLDVPEDDPVEDRPELDELGSTDRGNLQVHYDHRTDNRVGETGVTIPSDVKHASGPGLADALSPEELAAIRTKTQH